MGLLNHPLPAMLAATLIWCLIQGPSAQALTEGCLVGIATVAINQTLRFTARRILTRRTPDNPGVQEPE